MNISKATQSALECHQKGNLEQAEYLCKKILNKKPHNPDILHLLGVLYCQQAQYDLAVKYIRKALDLKPADIALAHYNLGYALQEQGQLDEAIIHYQQTIELNPSSGLAYCNLGYVLKEKGQLDESIAYSKKAIELNPSFALAYCNLGYALLDKGQLDESIAYSKKAIELNPSLALAYCNLGCAHEKKGSLDQAIADFQKAIELNPSLALAYCNLGSALEEKGRLDHAMAYFQKAIELNPSLALAYCNLGAAFHQKGQFDEAVAYSQKAIELNPSFASAYCNLAIALQEKGQIYEAITHFQKAIVLNPNLEDAHYNMSLALLLSGNFKQGWKEYEWRWRRKDFCSCNSFHQPDNFSQPCLNGTDFSGLSILIYAEQGFGDTIQFIRYAPLLAQRGAKVIFACQKELASLLQNSEGVDHMQVMGEPLPEFDMHCPLLSLPLVFDTTLENIPSKVPYVHVESISLQKWKAKVHDDDARLKIGLVWAGRPEHKNDRNRSCRLDIFSPLAEIADISFYSLQKGEAAQQAKNPPAGMTLIDYTEEINDFADTAALIENLDLIVSVDTSVVHLAGALGKPVWTLLPFVPDWRWMLNREDSPWYPTMRLFRQPSPGDWDSVITRISKELKLYINRLSG
jgi:tetratricopeptide (TPR) repeat protein